MRFLSLITLFAALAPSVVAQQNISGHFAPRSVLSVRGTSGQFHHDRTVPFYLPLGFPDLYSDAFARTGYPASSEPQVIMVQAPPQPVAAVAPTPTQPLLIELRGDRYVQLSGEEHSSSQMLDAQPASRSQGAVLSTTSPTPVRSSTPVTLVFRDGHQEEIPSFTISSGTLYAGSDFYSAGTWTRQIPLSSLNLTQTVNSNRDRGVKFLLPSAANEVVVGP